MIHQYVFWIFCSGNSTYKKLKYYSIKNILLKVKQIIFLPMEGKNINNVGIDRPVILIKLI